RMQARRTGADDGREADGQPKQRHPDDGIEGRHGHRGHRRFGTPRFILFGAAGKAKILIQSASLRANEGQAVESTARNTGGTGTPSGSATFGRVRRERPAPGATAS